MEKQGFRAPYLQEFPYLTCIRLVHYPIQSVKERGFETIYTRTFSDFEQPLWHWIIPNTSKRIEVAPEDLLDPLV